MVASSTWFGAEEFAREFWFQVGWIVQPDINAQLFLPITEVSGNWVKVAGNYATLGAKGKRFRIHAPPGVATNEMDAGLLSRWRAASSSRCLYAGYAYESPLAGRLDGSSVVARQNGKNYAGQHYTLHRHYDPYLMRFTSPDPIASGRNLFAYCENNPHTFQDPDGLEADERSASSRALNDALNFWGAFDWARPGLEKMNQWIPDPPTYGTQKQQLDYIQMNLGALGMIPGMGEPFDLINAGISLARGDYVGASLDASSAIPFLGNAPGAAKLAYRLNKFRKIAAKADDVADMIRSAQKVAGAGKSAGKLSTVSNVARTILEPVFARVGKLTGLPLGGKLTLGARIQRTFVTATKGYASVGSTLLGRMLKNLPGLRRINWEQGHLFFQRRWFRQGGPTQWYPANAAANLGLRRIANAGWNLMPMPRSLNAWLNRHPWGAFGFGVGVAGGVVGGAGASTYAGYQLGGVLFDDD